MTFSSLFIPCTTETLSIWSFKEFSLSLTFASLFLLEVVAQQNSWLKAIITQHLPVQL